VAIAWEHKKSIPHRQYLYQVEMAIVDSTKPGKREPGPFYVLGFTTAQSYRLDLLKAIHDCFFRVKVCKTNQGIDGEARAIAENSDPQSIIVDSPHLYRWSQSSPVANFKTPSVPDHPTGLHLTHLTHCSALLKWKKPANYQEHVQLMYRIYLNNCYGEDFVCIAHTSQCSLQLEGLLANCHYRVAVTAESTMGSSINNNTLHFSTRVTAHQSGLSSHERPQTSTLPPRTLLRAPMDVLKATREERRKLSPAADDFSALLDDRASTMLSSAAPLEVSMRSKVLRSPLLPSVGGSSPRGAPAKRPADSSGEPLP
jgi:hypothetical protein